MLTSLLPLSPAVSDALNAIGFVPHANVLLLLSTSGANSMEHLSATVKRMLCASSIAGTNVWVRCFDTQLRAETATLFALNEDFDAFFKPATTILKRTRYFCSGGGDDIDHSLAQALDEITSLPNGCPIDRLIVSFDGYDGTSIVPTQGDRSIPITYVIAHQDGDDVQTRLRYARERMPLAHVVEETALIRSLERYALESVVPVADATLAPPPMRARL